jgi:hypothetical protein
VELTGTVELTVGGRPLAHLRTGEDLPAVHSPRPYLHPLYTPSGVVVTDLAPADHPWHAGLSLAVADVDGDNLWGGNTFVAGQGYQLLDDHGSMRVSGPIEVVTPGGMADQTRGEARFDVVWRDRHGEPIVREHRTISGSMISGSASSLPEASVLTAASELTTLTSRPLALGSPGTRGRPDAGYGGWTLRLAPGLRGCEVLTSAAPGIDVGERAMGQPASWVCYRGGGVTLVMADASTSRAQPAWYVRAEAFPAVGPAPFFHNVVELAPGATLNLAVAVIIADGGHDPVALLRRLPRRC